METIYGKVIKGQSRGKKLGFPTINIPLSEAIDEGIYVSHIVIDNKKHNALTFIGSAKTFGETEVLAETYVFDFSEDVYGRLVSVTLLKKMRKNQKFDSVEALVAQMEEDKKNALAFFNNPIIQLFPPLLLNLWTLNIHYLLLIFSKLNNFFAFFY